MKPIRILLLTLGSLVLILIVGVVIALNSGVQTWAARRFAPASPTLTVAFSRVEAGLQHTRIDNLRVVKPGVTFTLPAAEVDVNMIDAARGKVAITRLVAHGWRLDLSATSPRSISTAPATATVSTPNKASPQASASTQTPPHLVAEQHARSAINGLLADLQLPVDLAIDGVDLSGEVILPEGPIQVVITGGGLAAGHEGNWVIAADFTGTDKTQLTVRGNLVAHLSAPRSFDRIELSLSAAATGPQFPLGAQLEVKLNAARESQGETYTAVLRSGPRELVNVNLAIPKGTSPLTGSWKIDVATADSTPFALGHALPDFVAKGHGDFSADRSLVHIKATGLLNAWGEKLGQLRPELAALGRLDFYAGFDLASQDQLVRINRCDLRLSTGSKPVVSVTVLQPIELNRISGALTAAPGANAELINIVIDGIPLAWAQPFMGDLVLTGRDLNGTFTVSALRGGVAMQTSTPLTLHDLALSQNGRPLVSGLDVALHSAGMERHGQPIGR
jgi:hypothetical protein